MHIKTLLHLLPLVALGAAASCPAAEFRHPGHLNTLPELRFIADKVKAGQNPWKQGFDKLKSLRETSPTYKASPVPVVDVGPYLKPRIGYDENMNDSRAVYLQALMWMMTGDERHARNVMDITEAWSKTLTRIKNSNGPLQAGWTGGNFARGLEIVKYSYKGWDPGVQERFLTMYDKVYYPLIKNLISFGYNGNWHTSMIDALISVAILREDHATYDRMVDRFVKEVVPYYFLADGRCQETCRDLKHTQMGFGGAINIAEIAWKQGRDVYGTLDNRMHKVLEYHARLLLGERPPAGLCGGKALVDVTIMPGGWEMAYNHYHNRKGMPMPWTEKLLQKLRPDGYDRHWGMGSLTHAEMGPGGSHATGVRPTVTAADLRPAPGFRDGGIWFFSGDGGAWYGNALGRPTHYH